MTRSPSAHMPAIMMICLSELMALNGLQQAKGDTVDIGKPERKSLSVILNDLSKYSNPNSHLYFSDPIAPMSVDRGPLRLRLTKLENLPFRSCSVHFPPFFTKTLLSIFGSDDLVPDLDSHAGHTRHSISAILRYGSARRRLLGMICGLFSLRPIIFVAQLQSA